MSIKLTQKKKITLEEAELVKLDPSDLDCCGVNRPVVKQEECEIYSTCDCCNRSVNITGAEIDDATFTNACTAVVNNIKSLDLLISNASNTLISGSSISSADFYDEDNNLYGKIYTGVSDGDVIRVAFTIAVPASYERWVSNFLTFKIKTSGTLDDSAVKLRIFDVDSTERYFSSLVGNNNWYTISLSKSAQSLSYGRWTAGLQMSIILEIYLDAGETASISNGIFSYI